MVAFRLDHQEEMNDINGTDGEKIRECTECIDPIYYNYILCEDCGKTAHNNGVCSRNCHYDVIHYEHDNHTPTGELCALDGCRFCKSCIITKAKKLEARGLCDVCEEYVDDCKIEEEEVDEVEANGLEDFNEDDEVAYDLQRDRFVKRKREDDSVDEVFTEAEISTVSSNVRSKLEDLRSQIHKYARITGPGLESSDESTPGGRIMRAIDRNITSLSTYLFKELPHSFKEGHVPQPKWDDEGTSDLGFCYACNEKLYGNHSMEVCIKCKNYICDGPRCRAFGVEECICMACWML